MGRENGLVVYCEDRVELCHSPTAAHALTSCPRLGLQQDETQPAKLHTCKFFGDFYKVRPSTMRTCVCSCFSIRQPSSLFQKVRVTHAKILLPCTHVLVLPGCIVRVEEDEIFGGQSHGRTARDGTFCRSIYLVQTSEKVLQKQA
eukprot:4138651-Amphidinium_carterae.1